MITKEQFEAYEDVRKSGVTNMFAWKVVAELTGLTKDQIADIQTHYQEYKSKFGYTYTIVHEPHS